MYARYPDFLRVFVPSCESLHTRPWTPACAGVTFWCTLATPIPPHPPGFNAGWVRGTTERKGIQKTYKNAEVAEGLRVMSGAPRLARRDRHLSLGAVPRTSHPGRREVLNRPSQIPRFARDEVPVYARNPVSFLAFASSRESSQE